MFSFCPHYILSSPPCPASSSWSRVSRSRPTIFCPRHVFFVLGLGSSLSCSLVSFYLSHFLFSPCSSCPGLGLISLISPYHILSSSVLFVLVSASSPRSLVSFCSRYILSSPCPCPGLGFILVCVSFCSHHILSSPCPLCLDPAFIYFLFSRLVLVPFPVLVMSSSRPSCFLPIPPNTGLRIVVMRGTSLTGYLWRKDHADLRTQREWVILGRREMTQKWGSNWPLADSLRVLIVFSFALNVRASRVLSSCRLVVLRFRCLVLRFRRLLFVIVSSWPGRYLPVWSRPRIVLGIFFSISCLRSRYICLVSSLLCVCCLVLYFMSS